MTQRSTFFCLSFAFASWLASVSWCEENSNLDPQIQFHTKGVELSLVAEHPDVMTPTGIDVDHEGGIWFVCCHTHFRPKQYDGPEHDEIVRWIDGERQVFYNATDATMDLELSSTFESDGWVYLAERDRILRIRDSDGDSVADIKENVAVLDTEGTYPHNGLSGMAWHPSGDLIFALGENYWKDWTLTGRDGDSVSGTGEGGIFRCRPDGSELRRIAKGFWNPFGICVRKDGTMFACENDPGSRPPCRLLHIVQGGDYGYQRSYGKASHHPFVCLNGELPGTLPMMFSLGEAPCGIVPFASGLLVTSWTDHRVDFYPLEASGASFTTNRIPLVSGSLDFRPTCIVQQSPTTYYLTDWVVGSYQLHGKGRVWKLKIDAHADERFGDHVIPKATGAATLARKLRAGGREFEVAELLSHARSKDPFLVRASVDALARHIDEFDTSGLGSLSPIDQISWLLACRKAKPKSVELAALFLHQKDPTVRAEALRWIADEKHTSFADEVTAILNEDELDYRTFEAVLATKNTLAGNPRAGVVDQEILLEHIFDESKSKKSRAYALRLVDPNLKKLWKQFPKIRDPKNPEIYREAVRLLAVSDADQAQKLLREWIPNLLSTNHELAPDAVAGLAASDENVDMLMNELATNKESAPEVWSEVLRLMRTISLSESTKDRLAGFEGQLAGARDLLSAVVYPESIKQDRPHHTDIQAWRERLANVKQPVDTDAGRRIFFHRTVGACYKCHRHQGRGNVVGPDLSRVGNDSDRLLLSLLQPSRDVDPQYFPRTLIFEDGTSFTGIMLRDGGGGKEFYRDSQGRERAFHTADIVGRKELRTSLMPEGLAETLTTREIRDLVAFLSTPVKD